jgi:uncharacterized cupin superfamily protein
MKLMDEQFLKDNLITHPYDSNPDYFAKINFLYFSDDGKLMSAYWEAPVGCFDTYYSEFDEINYVIEGELEITVDGETINIKKGGCFFLKKGDQPKFNIIKPTRTFLFIYPAGEEVMKDITKMIEESKK